MHDDGSGGVIRLAARLAVSGGRESLIRLALTAAGIAIGVTLLLLAAAADPAIRAHQRHTAWQYTLGDRDALKGDGDPLLWSPNTDFVDGDEMMVLWVAATGPGSPEPLGIDHVPEPGEVFVSPALAALIDELPADRLGDRFSSEPSGTIGDRYLAGPDDLVAVIGGTTTELRAMDAAEVFHVRTSPAQYQFTDVLRLVLGIGAVGLLMPVVVFVATSTRIGAARREQRFAALRLAGATTRQTNTIAGVEAAAAAVVGAACGVVGFALARPFAARIEIDGHESFLADVRVAPVLFVGILVAVPLLAVVTAMASLRRLQISPLGVARRTRRAQPTVRRLLPLFIGAVAFVVAFLAAVQGSSDPVMLLPVMTSFGLMIYGIVAAGPWFTLLTARLLGRTGGRVSVLLAGRRLEDDPASGFRAVSGLVLAVFVASVFSGVTPALLEENSTTGDDLLDPTTMVARLGAAADSGDDVLAAAIAAGAGDGLILHADPDPGRPLADPAVGRSDTLIVACDDLPRVTTRLSCPAGATAWVDLGSDDVAIEPAPYTPGEVDAMPAELLAVTTDGAPLTTDRVRTAIGGMVPGASPFLSAEAEAEANRELIQLNRVANLALTITLAIAGCGLAVAVAAGIIERKRPFTLLRLAGMNLRELRRTSLVEAAAPLVLIAGASAVLGLATSVAIIELAATDVHTDVAWALPSLGYWLSLVGGLVVAVALATLALPLLGRVTAPSSARFE